MYDPSGFRARAPCEGAETSDGGEPVAVGVGVVGQDAGGRDRQRHPRDRRRGAAARDRCVVRRRRDRDGHESGDGGALPAASVAEYAKKSVPTNPGAGE